MLFKYRSLIRNIFFSWVALAEYLMIKSQVVGRLTAALSIEFQVIRGFQIQHLDISVLIVSRLEGDYF